MDHCIFNREPPQPEVLLSSGSRRQIEERLVGGIPSR